MYMSGDGMAFMEGLSPSEGQELKDAFTLFDKNGDQSISKDELAPVLRALGRNPTQKEVDEMMTQADADNSGSLNYDEYAQIITKHMTPLDDVKIQLRQAFSVFDRDKSGFLDLKELQEVVCSIGDALTLKEAARVLQEVDTNHDGKVSADEFVAFLCDKV